jgi:hypothetical protein
MGVDKGDAQFGDIGDEGEKLVELEVPGSIKLPDDEPCECKAL